MLYRTKHATGRTLYKSRPLLISPAQAYSRPEPGKAWFATTTTTWRVDEIIKRRVRDWRRLTGETGHDGTRAETMRKDHDSIYTGTSSIFPAPLVEWILLRYGGDPGGRVLDAFAGGPPRGLVSTIMGFRYTGVELRQEQINEDLAVLKSIGLAGADYICGDGRFLDGVVGPFDAAISCPPYYDLEQYSDLPADLSNMRTYDEFNYGMFACATAHAKLLKPGAFVCFIVGIFRDKKGELVDFRAHTVKNFRDAGFIFWQDIVLTRNFASAAVRSTNAWRGKKLVPTNEHLLIFRQPEDHVWADE